jgi:NAD(P)-dependent dehydrogenase (short-subunit alcohol dehydrogenase family)
VSGDWTADDIPDQTGRTAVITGANTGLELETAKVLAAKGATVVLAVRDTKKGAAAVDELPDAAKKRALVQPLELASLASVRVAADELRSAFDRLDLLINNAGVMYTPPRRTEDGFERQRGSARDPTSSTLSR